MHLICPPSGIYIGGEISPDRDILQYIPGIVQKPAFLLPDKILA